MSATKDYPNYVEGTQNSTQMGTTYLVLGEDGKPVTNPDGSNVYNIKDQFRVDDEGVQNYNSAPETTTDSKKSNTGSGLEAALGTDYSWNTKGDERAKMDYSADILKAKADYLTNRQQLESQGQQAQQQMDMQKYVESQSADKVGWTGGYVLDQERQMNYLKATIQAQMYGQMELQKYGYDTALASARLAYDTNRYDLALEYYNTALSRAVSEAEITGYYVSPEAREMMNEYTLASKVLNSSDSTEDEKLRADKVLQSVYAWFEDNGISRNGVETIAHQDFIHTLRAAAEAKLEYANKNLLSLTDGTFVKLDANGEIIYSDDSTRVETFRFDKLSSEEILKYAATSNTAAQQLDAYLDSLITKNLQGYMNTIIKDKTTGEDGKTTITYNDINRSKLQQYLEDSVAKTMKDLYETAGDNEMYKNMLKSFDYEGSINSMPVTVTVNEDGTFKYDFGLTKKEKDAEAARQKAEEAFNSMKEKVNQKNSSLTDEDIQWMIDQRNSESNKKCDNASARSGWFADDLDNNNGDRGDGNNMSIKVDGERRNLQTGPQVKYGSKTDILLESYDADIGDLVVLEGVLYVRDKGCWYVVEARDNTYGEHWREVKKEYGLNYTSAPDNKDYTYEKQWARNGEDKGWWESFSDSVEDWMQSKAEMERQMNKPFTYSKPID